MNAELYANLALVFIVGVVFVVMLLLLLLLLFLLLLLVLMRYCILFFVICLYCTKPCVFVCVKTLMRLILILTCLKSRP